MSNETLDLLLTRRSIRAFTGDPVPQEDLDRIIAATQQSASSINAQQISLVVLRDKERIAKAAELCGGQRQVAGADVFVLFVIDFHRTEVAIAAQGGEQVIHASPEGLIVGAVDAGIALATFQTAAHSLGYGTTAIGGVRRDPRGMAKLLGLPEHTVAVVGSTLGVPDASRLPQIKPRVPREGFAMMETYDAAAVEAGVGEYDATLRSWWDAQGMATMRTYSADVAALYTKRYWPDALAAMRELGFLTETEK